MPIENNSESNTQSEGTPSLEEGKTSESVPNPMRVKIADNNKTIAWLGETWLPGDNDTRIICESKYDAEEEEASVEIESHLLESSNVENDSPLNLGQIIDLIEPLEKPDDDQYCYVYFDFAQLCPVELRVWQGHADALALSFKDVDSFTNEDGDSIMNVAQFLKLLQYALGKTFIANAGGECKADRDSEVWIANDGKVGNTVITGVYYDGNKLILNTLSSEW